MAADGHALPPVPAQWTEAQRTAATTGVSPVTEQQDGLPGGIASSRRMAATDLGRTLALREAFVVAGREHSIPPAVLAAIASRGSRVSRALDTHGMGDRGHAFGIMQIDTRHHLARGRDDPGGLAHIRQAAGILAGYRLRERQQHGDWAGRLVLKGAIVAYNSGVGNVRSIHAMDRGTTGEDYGSDVIAREQYYLAYL